LDYFEQAMQAFRDVHDRYRAAGTVNNAAATYHDLGDYQRALEIHQRALDLRREMANRTAKHFR
jgi:tetratricopeptide (TPR) repeat protein